MEEINQSDNDKTWHKLIISKRQDQWAAVHVENNSNGRPLRSVRNKIINTECNQSFKQETEDIQFIEPVDDHISSDINNIRKKRKQPKYRCMKVQSNDLDPLLLMSDANRKNAKRKETHTESAEQRTIRLLKMAEYSSKRLANESPQERARRLQRMAQYAAKRLANESQEQRAIRLARMSAYSAMRIANESLEERQRRLARMSAYAARRHAIKKMYGQSNSLSDNDSNSVNAFNSTAYEPVVVLGDACGQE